MEWVVRGGIATADQLMRGYGAHASVHGLFGFSVQYAPGPDWADIARTRRFPHGQLSIAYDDDLQGALSPLGYSMRLVPSPGRAYHHTFAVLYDATGQSLRALPLDAAQVLAVAFQRVANPYVGSP